MTLLLRFVRDEKGNNGDPVCPNCGRHFGGDPNLSAVGGLRRVGPVRQNRRRRRGVLDSGVRNGSLAEVGARRRCPLSPQKRTSLGSVGASV